MRIASQESKLTKAQVAKAVGIKTSDVLDWAEYPDEGRVVVVTTAGQKLEAKADKATA
jgi:hypothetical protein